jgi:hypothetical protein
VDQRFRSAAIVRSLRCEWARLVERALAVEHWWERGGVEPPNEECGHILDVDVGGKQAGPRQNVQPAAVKSVPRARVQVAARGKELMMSWMSRLLVGAAGGCGS